MKSSFLIIVLLIAYLSSKEVVLAANALRVIKKVLILPFAATATVKDVVFSVSEKIALFPEKTEQLSRTFEAEEKLPIKEKRFPITLDDILNAPKFVEQRVGNVTITTKQVMMAASPMNPIYSALKALKSAVNTFYGLIDSFDGDTLTNAARAPEPKSPVIIGRRPRGSREDLTESIKERIYGTVEVVDTIAIGAVAVVQSVPALVEGIIKLPETLNNVKEATEVKLESTKESIDAVLAWRPIDEAKFMVEKTQASIENSVTEVKQTAGNLVNFAKSTADFAVALTKPETYDLKKRIFGEPKQFTKVKTASKLGFIGGVTQTIKKVPTQSNPTKSSNLMKGVITSVQILSEGASYLKAKIDTAQAELAAREAAEKKRAIELTQPTDLAIQSSDAETVAKQEGSLQVLESVMNDENMRPVHYSVSSNVNINCSSNNTKDGDQKESEY